MKPLKKSVYKTLILMVIILSGSFLAQQTYAQNETPCDPQIWDAMKSRAWLETQREIAQNQNLIFKPDSVLEYTCFDELAIWPGLNFVGRGPTGSATRPFSETDYFKGHPPSFSFETTNDAIAAIAGRAAQNYMVLNFPDDYLNGRALDLNYTASINVGTITSSNDCDEMSQVWEAAKCLDFMDEPSIDGFYDFPWYVKDDPRKLPPSAAQCQPPAVFKDTMDEAFNKKADKFTMDPEPTFRDRNPYDEDPIVTHKDKIKPGNCGHVIETGITIVRSGSSQYKEKVCTNPGCTYVEGQGCQ